MDIVDAHHHFWDLSSPVYYPFLMKKEESHVGDYSAIRRNYLPEEYRRDTALHRVVATVHVEAEALSETPWVETEWLHERRAESGLPTVIVAHAWIDLPDSEAILRRQKQSPLVRGIRTKPVVSHGPDDSVRGQKRTLQDETWQRGLDLLQRTDLSWDCRVPWWHLKEAAEVIRQFPSLRVALNHTGLPFDRSPEGLAGWRAGMEALADNPNVWCKISSLGIVGKPWLLSDNRPVIRDAISIFGVDRCMFASNFPVDSLKGSWDYIFGCYKAAVEDFSEADKVKLFSANATAFYRIPEAEKRPIWPLS